MCVCKREYVNPRSPRYLLLIRVNNAPLNNSYMIIMEPFVPASASKSTARGSIFHVPNEIKKYSNCNKIQEYKKYEGKNISYFTAFAEKSSLRPPFSKSLRYKDFQPITLLLYYYTDN